MPLGAESTIPNEILEINFPDIERVILLGSGVLELHGIREAADIDLVTTPENMAHWLSKRFPSHFSKTHTMRRVADGTEFTRISLTDSAARFDIWEHWYDYRRPLGDRQIYVEDLLPISDRHPAGFRTLRLDELREMKAATGRSKDLADVALIDHYRR